MTTAFDEVALEQVEGGHTLAVPKPRMQDLLDLLLTHEERFLVWPSPVQPGEAWLVRITPAAMDLVEVQLGVNRHDPTRL